MNVLGSHPEHRQRRLDRGLNLLLPVSVAVSVATLLLAVIAVPVVFDTSSNTAQVRRGNELQACRALLRSGIDAAAAELDAAAARLDALTNSGFEALVRDDAAALEVLVAQAPEVRAAVAAAGEKVARAARDYRAEVYRSVEHPQAFLDDCRRDRG